MDLRKWSVFLKVADYGNFTRAGDELGYTQSGITQMMKTLEREVGFPLFNKSHFGVSLTKNAQELLPSIRTLLSADESLNQEISFLKGAKKGVLKIGSFISCSIHWLPEIIQEFQKEYPGIVFEIIEGDERELAEWIEDRRIDIAFTSYQQHQSYEFIPVLEDPMLAVFPKGHSFSHYDEIPLEWYQEVPFVVSEYSYANDVHRILKANNIKPDIRYIMTNDFSILSMVEHELGISILPELLLRGRTGNYETRPLKPRAYRRLGMAINSSQDISPAMRVFIKYARDYLLS